MLVAGVVVATAALGGLRWTTPAYIELTGAMPVRGEGGERVAGRLLAVKVESVRLANRITVDAYGKRVTRDTGGVFAVVRIEASAVSETASIGGATWVGPTGRRYESTARIAGPASLLMGTPLQPGLPKTGILVFELPEDEVPGGELRIAQLLEPRLDSEIRIRLDTRYVTPPTPLEIARGG